MSEGEEFVATTTTGEDESTRLQSNESNERRREGKQQLELRVGGELGQEAVAAVDEVEKEHMFEKVVTPSDVGKLNRLVIPKQHAEKYFPLDSSSIEKGLLLNFEDRSGKVWRFRYSYWNSSQSYVMTKGWSRFVKDKKLDAGDVVSFHRGVGELYRHRLYIDWSPRSHYPIPHNYPNIPPPNSIFTLPPPPYFLPTHYNNNNINARSSLYASNPQPYPHHFQQQQHPIYNNNYYTLHQHQQYPHPDHNYYLNSPIPQHQQQQADRMIIDSVPIAHHHHHHALVTATATAPAPAAATVPTTPGKRLRLFGVNMECASSSTDSTATQVPLPSSNPRGETSLHPSSQYPQ